LIKDKWALFSQLSYIFCFNSKIEIISCLMDSLLYENVPYFNIFYHFLWGIALVLVLLTVEKWTNTDTILTVCIVFQYNTSRIVHL
jgi:hypothetical protein